jgi:polysaccharide pyruvyl transferase WcaK-like protein
MIIEIRKAGFVNKGAELMLHAVVQKLRERYPDAVLTMAPIYGRAEDTFERMAKLGLYPKAHLWHKNYDFGRIATIIPRRLRNLYGLIVNDEVDVVIDAAGFSYTDQWGVDTSKELCVSSKAWKKNHTKLILLPQALGPYEKDGIDRYVREWVANADLIFPRERDSYNYLIEVVGEHEKIKQFPDFTNLVNGTLPQGYDACDKKVAIVPNYRMIDKTATSESDAYLPFLIRATTYLVNKKKQPFLLVHGGSTDMILAEKVSQAVGGIQIIKETNPLHIKGILGACDATVGSRFHGLVSALSQGVPSLATGWSHKYLRLFEDYGFGEGVVSVNAPDHLLHSKLDLITEKESAEKLRDKLTLRSLELKQYSDEMWSLVFSVIERGQ